MASQLSAPARLSDPLTRFRRLTWLATAEANAAFHPEIVRSPWAIPSMTQAAPPPHDPITNIATSLALIQQDLRYISKRMDEFHESQQATQQRVGLLENRMTKLEERSAIWQGAQATWSIVVGAISAFIGDVRR